ncbi:MAG TPA: hypothetical protein VGM88_07705 [Kofleriaceae bacterium]|jgi:hypothetical protein
MRSVALLLCGTLTMGACFPENAKARTISKITEGAVIVGGIAMLAANKGGQDCDMMQVPGVEPTGCHHETLGEVGFVLILAGLVGFIATISTTPDEKTPPEIIKAPTPAAAFKPRPLAGVGTTPAASSSATAAGTTSGSPAPAPAAPAPAH